MSRRGETTRSGGGRPEIDSVMIPMGWLNAVSLFQHLHRRVRLPTYPAGAGLSPSDEGPRDWPLPGGASEENSTWYQYLDNFDCPAKVPKPPLHVKQRAAYDRIGGGVSKQKEHLRELCVTRMVTEIDAVEGRWSVSASMYMYMCICVYVYV